MLAVYLAALLLGGALSAPGGVVYDQRQTATGEGHNVHVQLEDVLVLFLPSKEQSALLGTAAGFKTYQGPQHHLEVTVPPEFEGAGNSTDSQLVQEAVAAAAPEIPELETRRPETTTSTELQVVSAEGEQEAHDPELTIDNASTLSSDKIVQLIVDTSRVVPVSGIAKPSERTSREPGSTVKDEPNSDGQPAVKPFTRLIRIDLSRI